jgi:hypothetical protein
MAWTNARAIGSGTSLERSSGRKRDETNPGVAASTKVIRKHDEYDPETRVRVSEGSEQSSSSDEVNKCGDVELIRAVQVTAST